jgi:segregation and condensation protein B
MSLKAKLEAVIYAAEEPVTLAQLAALFAADALEWKATQETAPATTAATQAVQANEPLPQLGEAFDYLELQQATEGSTETPEAPLETVPDEARDEAAGEVAREADGPEVSADTSTEPRLETAGEAGTDTASESAPDSEAEEKRLARVRDREVRTVLRGLLDELMATYASDDRGIEIKEIAGGYRMATKPECHDAARMFVKSLKPALKLSLPALETLAVIAYKQPVTAPEVNEIRGVDSSGVFGSLLARKLIATAGRKQVIGRPILYKTTKEFLLRFGLKDVAELPSMEEFEKMAELEFEAEAGGEENAISSQDDDLSLESLDVDEYGDEPADEAAANAEQETHEDTRRQGVETAAMADSEKAPATQEADNMETVPGDPAKRAEPTPTEAAPAATSSPQEQAETETVPHD